MIKISKAEQKVVELLSQGYSNKQIADTLNVSINTIYTHVNHAYEKFGIFTNTVDEKNTLRVRLALAYLEDMGKLRRTSYKR